MRLRENMMVTAKYFHCVWQFFSIPLEIHGFHLSFLFLRRVPESHVIVSVGVPWFYVVALKEVVILSTWLRHVLSLGGGRVGTHAFRDMAGK